MRSTTGALPEKISADTGFWAPTNAVWCDEQQVDAYIATQRQRRSAVPLGAAEPANTPQQEMRAKVASPEGQEIYRRRKCTVEPVFGQIKQAMGFRRFSMRGMDRARGEWALVCTCHNVRKLWGARQAERLAAIAPALPAPRTGTGRGTVMGRGGAPRATRDGLLAQRGYHGQMRF